MIFLPAVNPHMEIPLTRGFVAKVSPEDYEYLKQFSWYANPRRHTVYAEAWVPVMHRKVSMHRLLLSPPQPFVVDHINRNGLDNRRCNLRSASPSQNSCNTDYFPKRRSPFKGLSWHVGDGKWHVRIRANGKMIHLGNVSDPETGARIYDRKARELHGDFAYLNFPGEKP